MAGMHLHFELEVVVGLESLRFPEEAADQGLHRHSTGQLFSLDSVRPTQSRHSLPR